MRFPRGYEPETTQLTLGPGQLLALSVNLLVLGGMGGTKFVVIRFRGPNVQGPVTARIAEVALKVSPYKVRAGFEEPCPGSVTPVVLLEALLAPGANPELPNYDDKRVG
jgi:hypothetical protein